MKLISGEKRQEILFILILVSLVVIFFWKVFFLGYIPIPADIVRCSYQPWKNYCQSKAQTKNPLISDCVTQFYPSKEYYSQIIKERMISLWNPLILCGTPCLILPFLPPLNILLYFFSPEESYGLTIILQVFLSGLFMHLFLSRGLKVNSFGSLIGAITFMFNGVFAVWLEFETTVGAGLWFPIVFLLIDKLITKQNLLYFALAALFIGMQFFSWHLQLVTYLLLSSLAYAVFKILLNYRQEKGLKGFTLVAAVFILSISLASAYIFPTFKQAETSFRSEVKPEELNPLPLANLVTFVIPDFYGTPAPPHSYAPIRGWFYEARLIKERVVKVGGENYNEYCGYIGVLPLILALLAGLLRKDRDSRFFFWFWIVSLLLALGTFLYLPLYWFAPGFGKMGISRIIFLFCFSGSILAGMGAESLTEMENGKWIIKIIVWVLGIATLGWLIFLLLPKFNSQLLAWHFSLQNPAMIIPILLVLSSIILLLLSLKIRNSQWAMGNGILKGAVLVVVSLDLLYFGMKYNPMTPKGWLFPETPSLNFLMDKRDKEPPFRIVAFDRILPPNTNLVYQLQSVEGYESLHSARYHDFMKELVSSDVYHNWINIFSLANRRFLQLLNARYILAQNELPGKDLKLVYDGEIKIYEDLKAYPRAWVVHEAKLLKTKKEIFEELQAPAFDPKKTVIIEEIPTVHNDQQFTGLITDHRSPITEIINYEPENVVIKAELPQPGYLILSDSYYPGWKVFVDGKEGRILRANYIMRAVRLCAGHHQVEFVYKPYSFKLGLYISLFTLFLIILLMAYVLFRGSA